MLAALALCALAVAWASLPHPPNNSGLAPA